MTSFQHRLVALSFVAAPLFMLLSDLAGWINPDSLYWPRSIVFWFSFCFYIPVAIGMMIRSGNTTPATVSAALAVLGTLIGITIVGTDRLAWSGLQHGIELEVLRDMLMEPSVFFSSRVPGLLFPIGLIGLTITMLRAGTLRLVPALILIAGILLFPIGRISSRVIFNVIGDFMMLLILVPVGWREWHSCSQHAGAEKDPSIGTLIHGISKPCRESYLLRNSVYSYPMKRYISVLQILVTAALSSSAATITSDCNGLWDDPSTWQGQVVPAAGDTVYVIHLIQFETDFEFLSNYVVIAKGAELCGFVELEIDVQSEIVVNGVLKADVIRLFGIIDLNNLMYANNIANQGVILQTGNAVVGFPGCAEPQDSCGVIASENEFTAADWKVWPNPTSGRVHVTADHTTYPVRIMLTDASGKTIMHHVFPADTELVLDLAELPAGIYHIRMVSDGTSATRTVVRSVTTRP